MNKRIIIIFSIVFLFLLSSCSSLPRSVALVSKSSAELCIVDGKKSLMLLMDSRLISKLCGISGLDIASMINELEPDASVYEISDDSYQKRNGYLSLLLRECNNTNRIDVLARNRKLLQKSDLIAKMDELTSGYDSNLLDLAGGVDRAYQYDLSSILYNATDWEDAKTFYSEWKNSILR